LSSRQSASSVYLSAPGLRILSICAVISGLAYLAMTKIGQLPVPQRIKL
jgi:hypothetical protein